MFHNKNGKLECISRSEFKNDELYYKQIYELKKTIYLNKTENNNITKKPLKA